MDFGREDAKQAEYSFSSELSTVYHADDLKHRQLLKSLSKRGQEN